MWILTAVAGSAGLRALVTALFMIKQLRGTAVGRMLFMSIVPGYLCLNLSAVAVYLALRGYGQEVAIPMLAKGLQLPYHRELTFRRGVQGNRLEYGAVED